MQSVHGAVLAALALTFSFAAMVSAQDQPGLVGKVLKVTFVEQQNSLVVTATGQVNTGGYTKPRLLRAVNETPPADGIQDYFLVAIPPDGIAAQVISEVKASDTWKEYKKEAPWLKGVRVHGIDGGVVVKMIK